jgi:hypothetical protein
LGAGDLRPYALLEFMPALLIPVLLGVYPGLLTRSADLFVLLLPP